MPDLSTAEALLRLLVAAGLVARRARALGLAPPPWVKTSLAPGSPTARRYLERAGLLDDLEAVGFGIVGFGCTTCIGNSGDLTPASAEALADGRLQAAVLSGNRNFPGRVHPQLEAGFLASPPLVVAFALAGDVSTPIGPGDRGPETVLTFIATKTIDPAASRRLHLNAAWLRNLDPGGDERRNRYRVVLGYSQLVASDLAVVLDYVREGQGRGEGAANVFEAGLHYQAGERVRLGIGAGVGVGRDSPRLRALLSVQVELGRR